MTQAPLKVLVAMANLHDHQVVFGLLGATSVLVHSDHVNEGRAAMQALRDDRYDCANLDASLRDQRWSDIMRETRQLGVVTPIIILSDGDSQGSVIDTLQAGAADCIPKGELSADQLLRSLWTSVRLSRAECDVAEAQRKLARETLYDSLTGLPNRALFLDRLEQTIALGKREGRPVALHVMDLNGFGEINKALGHKVGDQLLRGVAERLAETRRESDTIARLGSDEFAKLQPTGATLSGAVNSAHRIIESLAQPFPINGNNLAVGGSVGVALFPMHGEDSQTLLRHSDTAMCRAKRTNSGFAVYAEDDEAHGLKQISLAGDLRHAIEHDELYLHYQPKVYMDAASCLTSAPLGQIEVIA